ncbi:MAG: hypothetical protein P8X61_05400 [Limibacillus sp.]
MIAIGLVAVQHPDLPGVGENREVPVGRQDRHAEDAAQELELAQHVEDQ